MGLLTLPKRPANSNEPETAWYCNGCKCSYFLLVERDGATTIQCGQCREDITSLIAPKLSTGGAPCQR